MERWFAFLHLFTAFGFVGSMMVADWNGRAARAATDWGQRATCFEVIVRSARMAGFPSLLLLGVFGNLLLSSRGYRMAVDSWPRWVNGLWLIEIVTVGLVCLPAAGRLAALARASTGETPPGWEGLLRRWRIGNAVAGGLYLALLALMVFRWRG